MRSPPPSRNSLGTDQSENPERLTGRMETLTIAEEIILLILDFEKGDIKASLSTHSRDFVMAGAILMDLTLENRIDTDLERLVTVNPAPTGDDLLDPILSEITAETEARDTAFWLARIARLGDEIRRQVIARLIERRILESEVNGLLFLSRQVARAHLYPMEGEKTIEEVQFRIMRAIFSRTIPDPRDLVIISLAAACGVFESLLSREELEDVRERIDQLAKLDLIGREVAAAIRRVEPQSPAAVVLPYEEIPQAAGLPWVGNALDLRGDIAEFLTGEYRKHGPIFRIRAFSRRFVAFVGPEANVFLTKIGSTHLRSFEFWTDFVRAMGTIRMVVNMEGQEHLRMRRLLSKGYSPKVIEDRVDQCVDITRRLIAEWPGDSPIATRRAMQRIIGEQMGQMLTGLSPQGHLEDMVFYLDAKLMIHVLHVWPKLVERLPRFRRARRSVMELADRIAAAHQPENRAGKSPDFIDELLAMNREDPQFLSETEYAVVFLGPYFVGLDTVASACSYMLYALLKHPELLVQMRAEVDALFDRNKGRLSSENLRELDVTRRIALETLRIFPLFPAVTRTVANSFEFGGFRIPAGEQVLIGTTVGHRLPECFPEPERFDIERYRRSPPEHRKPGAYAPFGLGRHRCLGSGFAESQMVLTLATIVHAVDFELERPNSRLKIKYTPAPHPDASFRFRVTGQRRPMA